LQDGWPSLCKIRVGQEWLPVAIHIGLIGRSHRGRDDVERRFQNPANKKFISAPPGYRPLLIGVLIGPEENVSVVAGMDAIRRLGRTTRVSNFIPLAGLEQAAVDGWSEHVSESGEAIHLLRPELLPVLAGMSDTNVQLPELPAIIEASGLVQSADTQSAERAVRAALRAVRRSDFGRKVVAAYQNVCAMCGLDEGLVEGAHIYPVQAPNSRDEIWNAIALCANHHRAFDSHKIHVAPGTLGITIHPSLHDAALGNQACKALLDVTYPNLTLPAKPAPPPRNEMFIGRYEFFEKAYAWTA
jgi:hypothetical protein